MTARQIISFLAEMTRARNAMRTAEAAGNLSAQRGGRTTWNLDDYHAAVEVFDAMCPPTSPDDLMLRAKNDYEATVTMGGTV